MMRIPEIGRAPDGRNGSTAVPRCEDMSAGVRCAGAAVASVRGRGLCGLHLELARQEGRDDEHEPIPGHDATVSGPDPGNDP